MQLSQRLKEYARLMRLEKPIGFFLLLWPTLWALWLAARGDPDVKLVLIFVTGVVLMRSAGCILNDFADRHVDGYVSRTFMRPLAAGTITPLEAILLAVVLLAAAFLLVLFCNPLTILLSFVGAALAALYPYLKRITHLPQLGLGVAFSWGIPMAFAATTGKISLIGWFLFLASLVWPVIYDTMYAMVDREDDLKVGIKSTAILFSAMDKLVIGLLQLLFVIMMVIVGMMFKLHLVYYVALAVVICLFIYQQWLIHHADKSNCLRAFLNNNWVGLVIFSGIFLSYFK